MDVVWMGCKLGWMGIVDGDLDLLWDVSDRSLLTKSPLSRTIIMSMGGLPVCRGDRQPYRK